ncbi:hypothetical protein XMV208_000003 [Aliiroseovarius sp. xm-v-208]|nr:hypothetical protein [Aliiroseovarius sp. xm-v-208]
MRSQSERLANVLQKLEDVYSKDGIQMHLKSDLTKDRKSKKEICPTT